VSQHSDLRAPSVELPAERAREIAEGEIPCVHFRIAHHMDDSFEIFLEPDLELIRRCELPRASHIDFHIHEYNNCSRTSIFGCTSRVDYFSEG